MCYIEVKFRKNLKSTSKSTRAVTCRHYFLLSMMFLMLPYSEGVNYYTFPSTPPLRWWYLLHLDLQTEANRVELKIKTNKSKVHSLANHCTPPIDIIGQNVKGVKQFVYLGTLLLPLNLISLEVLTMLNSPSLFCPKSENETISTLTSSWGCSTVLFSLCCYMDVRAWKMIATVIEKPQRMFFFVFTEEEDNSSSKFRSNKNSLFGI